MQINIQSPTSLERVIEVSLPKEKVGQAFATQLKGYQQKAKIPGFRPGKAPLSLLRKNFHDQIGQDLASGWIREGYIQALEEGGFRPVGSPKIENVSAVKDGDSFSFTIECQVFPEVEPPMLEGFSLKKPVFVVSDNDVHRVIQRLRWNQAAFTEKTGPAALGDKVIIDFVGKVNGEAFDGGSAEGMPVVIGSGNLIAGFEEQLVGVVTGEKKSVEIAFPKNYGNADLAGLPAVFEMEVKQVFGRDIPALDSELANRFDLESLDVLRTEIKSGLEEEGNKAVFQQLKQQVMDILFETNPIELPSLLVEGQLKALWRGFLAQQNVNVEQELPEIPEDARGQFEPAAQKMVALGLLTATIGEKEELEAGDEEVAQELRRRAAQSSDPARAIAWYKEDSSRVAEIKMALLEDKVTQAIIDRASLEEQEVVIGDLLPSEREENQPNGIDRLAG